MSNDATNYAKKLVAAPDGSSFKAAEKAVLMVLAELHNPEVGCAWPSMRKLAGACCISERYCRQLIQGLERKQVIRRVFNRREDRSQTSNDFLFLALEMPVNPAKQTEARRKFQRISRIPISEGRGSPTPPPGELQGRETGRQRTSPPGTQAPSIEPLGELLGEQSKRGLLVSLPPTPKNAVRSMNSAKTIPNEKTLNSLCVPSLANTAWDAVMENLQNALLTLTPSYLEKRPGFVNGSKDWRSFRFNKVAVEAVEIGGRGVIVLVLSSPNPKATERGLKKYESRIATTLNRFYGCEVQIRLRGASSAELLHRSALRNGNTALESERGEGVKISRKKAT